MDDVLCSFGRFVFASPFYGLFLHLNHQIWFCTVLHSSQKFKQCTKNQTVILICCLPDVGMYVCPFPEICRSRGICIVALAPRDSSETASDNWKCRCSIANMKTAAPIVDYFDCYSHGNWYCCHCDYCYDLRLWDLHRHCRRHHNHRRRRHHYSRHQQHSAINTHTRKKETKTFR